MKKTKVKNILFSLLATLFVLMTLTENTSAQITENNNNVGIGEPNPQHKLVVRGSTELGHNTERSLLVENFSGGLTGIPGSHFGMKIRGPLYSHIVMDLQANDGGDGFYIRAPSNLVTETPIIDKIIFAARANGNVGIGTNNPLQKLHVAGNIHAEGSIKSMDRTILLGDAQRLDGDDASALFYKSNHSSYTQLIFRDKENETCGRILGSGNGAHFGLMDGDGNWSYLAVKDSHTQFRVNDSEKMRIRYDGRVGIGVTDPETKLEVRGIVRATSSQSTRTHRTEIGHDGSHGFINTQGAGHLDFRHNNIALMSLKGNGNVVIGNVSTPSADYKLYVEKGILTEKVRVAVKSTSDWSDYVFEKDYEVMPIDKLEDYVTENKHLPNVPSAEEMVKGGLDVATMDAKLLEKIEEAHLYIIELHKEIEALKTQINDKQ